MRVRVFGGRPGPVGVTRFGVSVHLTDAPNLATDDPQAVLLTQVEGVIAEYEKAKIAVRYRRGKLFRARAGEITTWKVSYGFRRIARSAGIAAHMEIYETEAAVVRLIFTKRAAASTIRELSRRLNTDRIPSPTGKAIWGHSTLSRLLRNEAYIGRVYFNRTETITARHLSTTPDRSRGHVRNGSRSTALLSSPTRYSKPPSGSPSTTASGARGVLNLAPGCSKDWSSAVSATLAPTATRCVAVTAPGTATTTAATTTHCALAAKNTAAPSATSAPTLWTSSFSARSAPH